MQLSADPSGGVVAIDTAGGLFRVNPDGGLDPLRGPDGAAVEDARDAAAPEISVRADAIDASPSASFARLSIDGGAKNGCTDRWISVPTGATIATKK